MENVNINHAVSPDLMADRGVRCEVFSSLEDDRLESTWRRLEARSAETGFESFDYVKPVYEAFLCGTESAPRVVVLYDKLTGEPVSIVPLVLTKRFGIRIVELLDFYVIDFAAVPCARARLSNRSYLRAAAVSLRENLPSCDFVNCKNLVDGSVAFDLINEALGSTKRHTRDTTYCVPLVDGGYADYVSSNRMYKKMRKKLRRLDSEFGIEIRPATKPAEIEEVMDAMFMQRKVRFEKLDLYDGVSDPRRQQIFRQVAHKLCQDDRALLLGAWIDGACVATSFGACSAGGLFTSQLSSFAEGPWAKHSLGQVTVALEIDWANARQCQAYNLGAGEADYKSSFGVVEQRRVCLETALSWSGWLYLCLYRMRMFTNKMAKQVHRNPRTIVRAAESAYRSLRVPKR